MSGTPIRELANAYIEINGVELSNQGNKVDIKREGEVLEATGFRAEMKQKVVGISDAGMSLTLFLTYGEGSLNSVLAPIYTDNETVEVAVKAKKGLASASNPRYVMKEAQLPSYPISLEGPKTLLTVSVEFINVGQGGVEELDTPVEGETE